MAARVRRAARRRQHAAARCAPRAVRARGHRAAASRQSRRDRGRVQRARGFAIGSMPSRCSTRIRRCRPRISPRCAKCARAWRAPFLRAHLRRKRAQLPARTVDQRDQLRRLRIEPGASLQRCAFLISSGCVVSRDAFDVLGLRRDAVHRSRRYRIQFPRVVAQRAAYVVPSLVLPHRIGAKQRHALGPFEMTSMNHSWQRRYYSARNAVQLGMQYGLRFPVAIVPNLLTIWQVVQIALVERDAREARRHPVRRRGWPVRPARPARTHAAASGRACATRSAGMRDAMRRVNEAAKVARGVKGGSMMIVAAAASLVLSGCVPSGFLPSRRCARRPTMRSRIRPARRERRMARARLGEAIE